MENYRIKKVTFSNGDVKYIIEERRKFMQFNWLGMRWADSIEWREVSGYYGQPWGNVYQFNTAEHAQYFIDNVSDKHVVNEEIVK